MRSYWRILLDVRRCLRFDPTLSDRVATQGLRSSDFEERVVTVVRWEDADGIRAYCMRLHRIGLTVSANRDHYRGDVPWELGPCWPGLPSETQEVPDRTVERLWRDPLEELRGDLPGWKTWSTEGLVRRSVLGAPLSEALGRLSADAAQRKRRRAWLLRVAMLPKRRTLVLAQTDHEDLSDACADSSHGTAKPASA